MIGTKLEYKIDNFVEPWLIKTHKPKYNVEFNNVC